MLPRETITLVRQEKVGEDSDGNDVYGSTDISVPGSLFAPVGSTELIQGEDVVIANPTAYMGPRDSTGDRVVAKPTDQVRRANGDLYNIDGKPDEWPDWNGRERGPVVRLEKVT